MKRYFFQIFVLVLFVIGGLIFSMGLANAADAPKQVGHDQRVEGQASRLDIKEVSVTLPADIVLVPLDPGVPSGIGPLDPQSKVMSELLSEGFEGSWPLSPWSISHNTGFADVDWGKSSFRRSAGSYSIWPAASGSQAPGAGGNVPANAYSWAIVGPIDLTGSTWGQLEFDLWMSTELDEDHILWLASLDGENFNGFQWSGSSDWTHITADLTDFGSADNVTNQPVVYFGFLYSSNEQANYEGVYIDNVVLNADVSGGGSNCGTYVIDDDNDNNANSGQADGDWHTCLYNYNSQHPIEFHVDINETTAQTAQLLLLCNDVDEEGSSTTAPEIDNVYMNNTFIGTLTGANEQDSTTALNVPTNSLIAGRNIVRIDVNQGPGTASDDWCVKLIKAQLIIDGGCEGQAACRSVTTDRQSYNPGDNVTVSYEIDTNIQGGPQQIRVESNLVAPSGNTVSGTERNYTVTGLENEPQDVILNLPAGSEAGSYRVEIWVFDSASGRLDTSCSTTVTVAPVSNCTLSCNASVPPTGTVGIPITFTGSANATNCSSQPSFFWYPDLTTTAMAPGQTVQLTYDQPGTYNWELDVVVDNEVCRQNGTITISAAASCNLTCTASVPATGTVGVPITFSGSANATNCSGQPSFFWYPDLTTTATAPGQTVQVTYDQAGTYNWELDVVVDNETCRRTGSITISGGGGGPCTYSYWIAVASRATGVANSQWRTDLGLLSLSNATASVEVRFYGPNGLRTRTTTVAPRNQVIITDVIEWVAPGTIGSGAIQVCSNQPLYISSRTYNQLPAGDPCFPNGTFGQYIGSLNASAGIGAGQFAWLPQLVENWSYRTNIGLMNMGSTSANVRVTLYDGSGRYLASYTENLTAGEWSQKSRPFYNTGGLGLTNMPAGSALVEVLTGSGVIAYASLIDNFTNDATTIWMVK